MEIKIMPLKSQVVLANARSVARKTLMTPSQSRRLSMQEKLIRFQETKKAHQTIESRVLDAIKDGGKFGADVGNIQDYVAITYGQKLVMKQVHNACKRLREKGILKPFSCVYYTIKK